MTKRPGKQRGQPARPAAAGEAATPLLVFDAAIVADLREMLPAADFNGLLSRAIEALPATMSELHAASDQQDREETRRQAHKLAGLAGNFGCNALMEAARRIEAACADQQTRRLPQLLQHLDSLLAPTLKALSRQQVGAVP